MPEEATVTDAAETTEEATKESNRYFIWHHGRTKIHFGEPPAELVGVVLWRVVYRDPLDPQRYTYDLFVAEDNLESGRQPWRLVIQDSGALVVQVPSNRNETVMIYGPGSWHSARPSLADRYPDGTE
jgi:hypothetical protein